MLRVFNKPTTTPPADFAGRRATLEKQRAELAPLPAERARLKLGAEQKEAAASESAEFRTQNDEILLQKHRFSSDEELSAKKESSRNDLRASFAAKKALAEFEAEHPNLNARTRILDADEASLVRDELLAMGRPYAQRILEFGDQIAALEAEYEVLRLQPGGDVLPELLLPLGVFLPLQGDARQESARTLWNGVRLGLELKFPGILPAGDPMKALVERARREPNFLTPRALPTGWLG
jgi:hypothetical protein